MPIAFSEQKVFKLDMSILLTDESSYQERINKAYKQFDSLIEKAGSKKDKIKEYIDGTRADIQKLVNSLFSLDDLDAAADTQMKKLQDEWRTLTESSIKKQLATVGFKIEYDSMAAVCQSDRIEVVSLFIRLKTYQVANFLSKTLLPLLSILLSRHIYLMSQKTVKDEDIEEATTTMSNILEVVRDRISDLRRIWRRQRQDVDVQIRYYVNGLFQDFYKVSVHLDLHQFKAKRDFRNITKTSRRMTRLNTATGTRTMNGVQKTIKMMKRMRDKHLSPKHVPSKTNLPHLAAWKVSEHPNNKGN